MVTTPREGLFVVMGVRDYLCEQRSRFPNQEAMAAYIEKAGKEIDPDYTLSQAGLSLWLRCERYPDRRSLKAIRRAFGISDRKWKEMRWADVDEEDDSNSRPVHMSRTNRKAG